MSRNINIIVDKEMILLEFLIDKTDFTRKKIKSLLGHKAVLVNNKIVSKYDYELKLNQMVSIDLNKKSDVLFDRKIDIIYEDKEMIVINKPSGLLSIDDDNDSNTAYKLITEYVKGINKNNRVFIVHRLDKDTSGILLFAKNEKIKRLLQDNWDTIVTGRYYYAVVNGILKIKSKEIISYLKEDKNLFVYSTTDPNGKKAITRYEVLKENKNYSFLNIELKTGRKNQIRVHMKDIGHPIVGDKKYGNNDKTIRRLGLHAYKLVFIHPITKKIMIFETKCPKELINIF